MFSPTGPITLTGTIVDAVGRPVTGAFLLRLNTYGSVLPSAGGYKGIQNVPVRVEVVDGSVISPSAGVYGNDALAGPTYYIVEFVTNTGIKIFLQNWLILGPGPYDMGSVQMVQTSTITAIATTGLPSVLGVGKTVAQAYVLTDTATSVLYQLSVANGALTLVTLISPSTALAATAVASLTFADSVTGLCYQVVITNGAVSYTQVATTTMALSQLVLIDTATNIAYLLKMSNGALTVV